MQDPGEIRAPAILIDHPDLISFIGLNNKFTVIGAVIVVLAHN